MLTLKQMAAVTPRNRRLSAQYVKLLKVKSGYDDDGQAFIVAQTYSTKVLNSKGLFVANHNKDKYITHITFLDKKLHAKVSCSCADFCFREEWVLTERDAADIEYSNGEPPVVTNPPPGTPYICKHLYKLYLLIKDKLK